jgi:hypothetical protein
VPLINYHAPNHQPAKRSPATTNTRRNGWRRQCLEHAVNSATKRAQRSLHRGLGFLHLLLVSRKIA